MKGLGYIMKKITVNGKNLPRLDYLRYENGKALRYIKSNPTVFTDGIKEFIKRGNYVYSTPIISGFNTCKNYVFLEVFKKDVSGESKLEKARNHGFDNIYDAEMVLGSLYPDFEILIIKVRRNLVDECLKILSDLL